MNYYRDPRGECTMWCISSPRLRPDGSISALPKNPTEHRPSTPETSSPVSRIFSGRNCAVLKQIYFSTRHNIWTNNKKKLRTFLYSFIKEQKKKKRTEDWGFLLFASSAFWLLACNVRCVIFATRRRNDDTFRWKWKMSVGCWSRSFFFGDCPVDSVYRKVFVLNMPM